MNKYLSFDKMITPLIIKILFWIGVGLSVIMGLIMIMSGVSSAYGGGMEVFTGLMMVVFGPLLTRIYCELLIIFFKMQETLVEIKDQLRNTSQQ